MLFACLLITSHITLPSIINVVIFMLYAVLPRYNLPSIAMKSIPTSFESIQFLKPSNDLHI